MIKLYPGHDKLLGSRDNCSTRTAFLPIIQQRIQGGRDGKGRYHTEKVIRILVGRSKNRKIMMYTEDVEYVDFSWTETAQDRVQLFNTVTNLHISQKEWNFLTICMTISF